jgi:hypothetical protein
LRFRIRSGAYAAFARTTAAGENEASSRWWRWLPRAARKRPRLHAILVHHRERFASYAGAAK